jgi:hypothetical protein
MDKFVYAQSVDYTLEGNTVYVFYHRIPPEIIEYIITPDGIRYVGQRGKFHLRMEVKSEGKGN